MFDSRRTANSVFYSGSVQRAQTGGYTLKKISIQILVLILSLLAAGISSLLLQKHMTGKAGISLFEAGCEVGGDTGNVSCAKVLQSPYAVWPHVRGNEDAEAIRKKVPVAFLGLIYYLALAVWFIGVGLPDASRRWVFLLPGLLIAAGVAASVYFLFVMFAKLDYWCPWCLVTHVSNFGIAVCLVWMWRIVKRSPVANVARGAATPRNRTPPAQATAPVRAVHPSGRLVFVTLLAMALVVFGQRYVLSSAVAKMMTEASERGLAQCKQGIKQLRGDPARLVKLWDISDPQAVPIRPDDPVRQRGAPICRIGISWFSATLPVRSARRWRRTWTRKCCRCLRARFVLFSSISRWTAPATSKSTRPAMRERARRPAWRNLPAFSAETKASGRRTTPCLPAGTKRVAREARRSGSDRGVGT